MRRDHRASATGLELPRPIELPEIVFAAIFIPIAAFSWVGILLAELGAFSGGRVLAGGAAISAVALAAAVRDLRASAATRAPVSASTWLILVLTLGMATALFAKPGEHIIEGADASVYLAIGRNIAATGGIPTTDPVVDLVPRELRQAFFPVVAAMPDLEARFPGGLLIQADGKVHPAFFHLLPAWLAMALAAAGPYGAYFVNVVFAVLSVFAVWLIGRRTWSPVAGHVSAVLLAINVGEIYHARLASSEVLGQFFLLSGIYFTVLAWDSRQRVAGACAGAAIGFAAFTRIDLLLLMPALAALWLLFTRRGQLGPAWRWYAGILTFVAGHATIHALTVSGPYTRLLFGDISTVWTQLQTQMNLSMFFAALALTGLAALALRTVRGRWLAWAGIGIVLTLHLLAPGVVLTNIRLLSPVGLGVVFLAIGIILTRPMDWRVLAILLPFLAEVVLLLAWRDPDSRRAIPAVLPGGILLIGFVVGLIADARGWVRSAGWLVPVAVAGWFVGQSAPVVRTPPARGIHAQVSQLADHIPPDAVVITDRSVPGHLALALQHTFGRSALRMDGRPAGDAGIAPLVEKILASGRPVFAAISPLATDRPTRIRRSDVADFDMRETHATTLRYNLLVPVRGRTPSTMRLDEVPIALYRIQKRDIETTAAIPLTLDLGGDDFAFIIRGFHEVEAVQFTRVRWTTDVSQVALPRLAPSEAIPALVLRLSAHRPSGIAPAVVRVAIDNVPVGVIATTSELRDYCLALPAPILKRLFARPTTLTISADSFVPKDVGLNDDPRRLGVVLDWIRIK